MIEIERRESSIHASLSHCFDAACRHDFKKLYGMTDLDLPIIIDFTKTSILSSAGIGMILILAEEVAQKASTTITLKNCAAEVSALLDAIQISTIAPNLEYK